MKVGDLVRNMYTDEVYIITSKLESDYFVVSGQWQVPKEHLEIINDA